MAVLNPLQASCWRTIPTTRSKSWTRSTIRKTRRWARGRCRSRKCSYIEQDDFREDPPKEFFRLAPGPRSAAALRLRHQVRLGREGPGKRAKSPSCAARTIRPRAAATRPTAARSNRPSTGSRPSTRSEAEVRLYDHLFTKADPGTTCREGTDYKVNLNPNSLTVGQDGQARAEPRGRARPAAASSSSGWAISASTRRTRDPGLRSSTAPCRSAIRGRRSRRKRRRSQRRNRAAKRSR